MSKKNFYSILIVIIVLLLVFLLIKIYSSFNIDHGYNINDSQIESGNNAITYNTPDFTEKAGFKINLEGSMKNIKLEAKLLPDNSTAQLDLRFNDNSLGSLLVYQNEYKYIYSPDDEFLIDDIKVSVKQETNGIYIYEWQKDDFTYVYHTGEDLKKSDVLKELISNASAIKTINN